LKPDPEEMIIISWQEKLQDIEIRMTEARKPSRHLYIPYLSIDH